MRKELFHYSCTIDKVIDGDTIYVLVDLGFKIYVKKALRLARINAPELSTPEGKLCKEYLMNTLHTPNLFVTFTSTKLDTYGRSIAEVYVSSYVKNPQLNLVCLNDSLVSNGHAVYKSY